MAEMFLVTTEFPNSLVYKAVAVNSKVDNFIRVS